jgi:hypothetical protein
MLQIVLRDFIVVRIMCSLHPDISTLICNVGQHRMFVQPGHNISDVQSTYPRV